MYWLKVAIFIGYDTAFMVRDILETGINSFSVSTLIDGLGLKMTVEEGN